MIKPITFDPRGKMLLFFTACLFSMNVANLFILIGFVTIITVLLLLSNKIKSGLILYSIFLVGAIASYVALEMSPNFWTGLIIAIFSFFRIVMPTIIAFALLFQTTKISEYMAAFEKFKIPNVIVIPLTVMFRFFPTVQEEWRCIRLAMSFRGIKLGASGLILHPVKTIEYIIVPLLFSCVNIMDELVAASLARGLESDKKRTCYFELKMKFYDYLIILVSVIFIILVFLKVGE